MDREDVLEIGTGTDSNIDTEDYGLRVLLNENIHLRNQIAEMQKTLAVLVTTDIEKSNKINELGEKLNNAKNSEIVAAANAQTKAMEAMVVALNALVAKPLAPPQIVPPSPYLQPPFVSTTYGPLPSAGPLEK